MTTLNDLHYIGSVTTQGDVRVVSYDHGIDEVVVLFDGGGDELDYLYDEAPWMNYDLDYIYPDRTEHGLPCVVFEVVSLE